MRYPDWDRRLHDALEAAQLRPFDYGTFNCGLFAAECIDAMVEDSGRVKELRAWFSDEASALAFVADHGSIEAAVTARLGEPKSWAHARRGDVCLMPTQDGPGLGICVGHLVAMMMVRGLGHVKLDLATAVWRVD